MHMFGLYSFKPLAVARVSGMRFVHVKRRDADPADDVAYLRHASAMSAAIAKNLSGVMSQPSELVHASGTRSDAAAAAAFMESHSQYSFIAVVSLMSLFLVITISATGLLLAFCRKKNAVFTASVKEDADSQFELDDIDNSDTEMCRGDKGECYFHLSDDYDEDSDITDDDYEPEPRRKTQTEKKSRLSKRSTTFPQIKSMLASCTGDEEITEAEGKKTSTVTTPLIQNTQSVNGSIRSGSALSPAASVRRTTTPRCPTLQHQNPHSSNARFRQNARALVCRNPDHQHFQKQHHNCVYSRPHYHHKRNVNCRDGVRPLMARLYRYQLPCAGGGGKLHRSYTIHDIPQTGSESKSTFSRDLGKCGVKIKVQNMEQIVANNNNNPGEDDDTSGSLPFHYISTISSSIGQFKSPKADDEDDMFNEDDTTFSNLKLRLEEFHAHEVTNHDIPPDPYQVQVVGGRVLNTQETPYRVLQHTVGAQGRFADYELDSALSRNNQGIDDTIDSAHFDSQGAVLGQRHHFLMPTSTHESIDDTIDSAHFDSQGAVLGQRHHFLTPTSTHESIGDRMTRGLKPPSLASSDSPICNISTGQCSSTTGPNADQLTTTTGDATFQEMYSLHELSSGDRNSRHGGRISDISTARLRPEGQQHHAHTIPVPIPPPPSQRSKRPQSHAAKTPRMTAAAQWERTLQQRKTIPASGGTTRDPQVQQIAPSSQHPDTSSIALPPLVSSSSSLTVLEETTNTVSLICPNLRGANSKGNMPPTALVGRRGDRGGEEDDDDSDDADEVRVCLLQDDVGNDNVAGGEEDDQTKSLLK